MEIVEAILSRLDSASLVAVLLLLGGLLAVAMASIGKLHLKSVRFEVKGVWRVLLLLIGLLSIFPAFAIGVRLVQSHKQDGRPEGSALRWSSPLEYDKEFRSMTALGFFADSIELRSVESGVQIAASWAPMPSGEFCWETRTLMDESGFKAKNTSLTGLGFALHDRSTVQTSEAGTLYAATWVKHSTPCTPAD